MQRAALIVLSGVVVVGLVFGVGQPSANAIPPFKKQFDAMYVHKESSDATEKAFAEAAKKAKCNLCHIPKKKKTMRNAYGNALAELLDKKKDAKNIEKIKQALVTVGGQKVNPSDENSPTWNEVIKEGKLPSDITP